MQYVNRSGAKLADQNASVNTKLIQEQERLRDFSGDPRVDAVVQAVSATAQVCLPREHGAEHASFCFIESVSQLLEAVHLQQGQEVAIHAS